MIAEEYRDLPALSVRQPWAWLIANGWKDVENRTWKTQFRGRVLIHAGALLSLRDYEGCRLFALRANSIIPFPPIEKLDRGGIVGVATIVDCVERSDSPWFMGGVGFVIEEAKALPFEPCRGALGFFKPAFDTAPAASPGLRMMRGGA